MTGSGLLVVIDTATSQLVAALADGDGELFEVATWPADHRHGETLLPAIDGLLGRARRQRSEISAVIVGIGPGAFTGLRVGLATAKGIARALGVPLVGVGTAEALAAALAMTDGTPTESLVVLLPAGPADRIAWRHGAPPRLLVGAEDPGFDPTEVACAIDLEGRAPEEALERGTKARAGLAAALAQLGAERLAGGQPDDLAMLVPEYVTLPRGVREESGEVEWSNARR